MTEKEKMLAELPYNSFEEGLVRDRKYAQKLMFDFNRLPPDQFEKKMEIIKDLLGSTGEQVWIESPFHCDYGSNIEVGNRFYSNFNLTILDGAKVTIGDNCFIGPNVSIFTSGHPIDPVLR